MKKWSSFKFSTIQAYSTKNLEKLNICMYFPFTFFLLAAVIFSAEKFKFGTIFKIVNFVSAKELTFRTKNSRTVLKGRVLGAKITKNEK
jgi:hypothetical protein